MFILRYSIARNLNYLRLGNYSASTAKLVKASELDKIESLPFIRLCFVPWFTVNAMSSDVGDYSRRNEEISRHIAEAQNAIKGGKFKQAERILESAIEISDKTPSVEVTLLYDLLATLVYEQGNTEAAADVLMRAIQRLTEMGLPLDDNGIVEFSLKLCRVFVQMGEHNLAELGYRNCLAIQKKKYVQGQKDEVTARLWLNALFWYGKFLSGQKRYEDAKRCFTSATDLCYHLPTTENKQIMVIMYNLGEMSYALGDYDTALVYLGNAISIAKSCGSPDLSSYYVKYGIVQLVKGAMKEAEYWCHLGKKTAEKDYDERAISEGSECLDKVKELLL